MSTNGNRRRTYGTGSISEKNGNYYGQWRANGRLIKRKLGPVRVAGTRDGMTKTMTEAKLRALISELVPPPPVVERLTVDEAGARLIAHLTTMRRKHSTTESYESYLRVHIAPYFESRPIAKVTKEDVEGFVAACINGGQSVKSTLNYLGLLHGIFDFCDQERMDERQSGQARREAEEPRRGRRHPISGSDGARRAARRGARRRSGPGRARHVHDRRDDRHAPG